MFTWSSRLIGSLFAACTTVISGRLAFGVIFSTSLPFGAERKSTIALAGALQFRPLRGDLLGEDLGDADRHLLHRLRRRALVFGNLLQLHLIDAGVGEGEVDGAEIGGEGAHERFGLVGRRRSSPCRHR